MNEQPLSGGLVNDVVRIGDAVRRGMTDRSEFVHRHVRQFHDLTAGTPLSGAAQSVRDAQERVTAHRTALEVALE
jgi:hypothetical protein